MSLEAKTNPFQLKPIQNPVEFIGRQKELKNAVDSMASFKHILLQGEKGIGKTSFLNYLTCSDATAWIGLPEDHLCVYFNLQYFIGERLEHILQTLSKTIASKIHTSTFPDYAEEFHQLAEKINEKFDVDAWCREFQQLSSLLPCKLHVLFDDFAQIDGVEEEFYGIIQKISHVENVSYVIASSTKSAFFQMNIPTKIPLGPFQEKEVYQLIFDYFIRADVEPSLSEKLWEHAPFLHETTGYHPFFLQNYCYHLYARMDTAGWPEGKAQKEALRDFKRFAIPRFQEYWKTSSQEEQDLMKKLATSQLVDNDNYRVQPVIRKLQNRSLIIQSRKSTQIGSEWSLFSSLFRDWIIKNEIQKLECPYRGLAAFQEQHARFFFGRERFVDRLVDVVVPSSVVSIIGSSGSGKSSVVFAGLIPRLRAQGNWVITSFSPGHNPFYELAISLERILEEREYKVTLEEDGNIRPDSEDVGDVIDQIIRSKSIPSNIKRIKQQLSQLRRGKILLQEILQSLQEIMPSSQFLLVIDQFEEFYTLSDSSIRSQAFHMLFSSNSFLQTPVFHIVLTLRADFLAKILSDKEISYLFQDSVEQQTSPYNLKLLGAMTYQELKSVIEEPAEAAGLYIEERLTERILSSLSGSPGNLPLLQFALTLLWTYREGNQLTMTSYERIGGVEKAIAHYAESLYENLELAEQHLTRQIFIQLVQPGEGTEDTRRIAARQELGEESWNFIESTLVFSRLVIIEKDGRVTLAHEALIKEWPRLRLWIDEDRDFRQWQERLRATIWQWENSKKDQNALLRGKLLIEAEDWLQQRRRELHPSEREFIEKSREREDEEQEKWKRLYQESYLKTIESYNWSGRSLALSGDTFGALLASVKAGELLKQPGAPVKLTYQTIIALRERVDEFGALSQQLEGGHSYISCLAFSPDGSILASGNWDKTISVWAVKTGQLQHSFSSDPDPVYSLAFSPDGSLLVSGTWNNSVKLWDVENGREKSSLCEHLAFLNSLRVSPDGQVLAFGSWNQTIVLWDLQTNKLVARLSGHAADVSSLCFSPDEKILASGDLEGVIKLWHVSSGKGRKTLQASHISRIKDLSFSGNSSLISTSEGGIAILWDIETGTKVKTFKEQITPGETIDANPSQTSIELENISIGRNPDSSISVRDRQNAQKTLNIIDDNAPTIKSLSFSPNGTRLAAASSDHRILLWDLSVSPKIKTLNGHTAAVNRVAFHPANADILASGGADGAVRLWNLSDGTSTLLSEHIQAVTGLAFHPQGDLLVSGSTDGQIIFWNMIEHTHIPLDTHAPVQELVFNHDGNILASGHADNTIRLWNVADNTEIAALSGQALTLAFSPDHSKILASGGYSSSIALWNFELEELLRLGCQELLKYADNYPGFSKEDRQLCETIISRYPKNES